MKQQRLDGLADGIFAIVMTLLAFDMKIPAMSVMTSDLSLWQSLGELSGTFFSFILSFALLFTYWRAHHFIVSMYPKTLTVGLANYNALFFLLITLVPFSAHFLGIYYSSKVAIVIYGTNVILIGMTLFFMRRYIENNPNIEVNEVPRDDVISGYVRILFPVFAALVAVLVSLWNTNISLFIFALAILFNLMPASTNWLHNMIIEMAKD